MKLICFDLETTGLNRKVDQIIQFAALKLDTETNKILAEYNQYIQPIGNYTISVPAYFKHGITAEFLKDKPHFKDIVDNIVNLFNDCDAVLTYNGNFFDIPFLKTELQKYSRDIDFMNLKCFDAFLEEKRRNGNKLSETYARYKGKTMNESGLPEHDAFSDIKATYSVFIAQQRRQKYDAEKMYGEDNAVTDMVFLEKIQPCFNIGKYKGISLEWLAKYDQNYLQWCISDKSDFMNSTKEFIKQYVK